MQSESFSIEDEMDILHLNLVSIISQDRERGYRFIPLLAFRASVRALPLISIGGVEEYGVSVDGRENRFRYLNGLMKIVSAYVSKMDEFTRFDTLSRESEVAREAAGSAPHEIVSYVSRAMSYAAVVYDYFYLDKNRSGVDDQGKVSYQAQLIDTAIQAFFYSCKAVPDKKMLIDSIGRDVSSLINDRELRESEFISAPLWGVDALWFSDATKNLSLIIDELRLRFNGSTNWRAIDYGLSYLQTQANLQAQAKFYASKKSDDPKISGSKYARDFEWGATNKFLSDKPNVTDKLNRQKLVNALAINLTHSTNKHHRAIGLLGEWGSGKSTVLKLLKQKLKETHKEQPFVFGEFNAWAYEHSDNIQAGIAQEVLSAVTSLESEASPKEITDVVILGGPVHVAIKWCNNWFKKLIISALFRSWITLCYSVRAQFFKLLKSLLVLCIALMPLLIPPAASIPTFPAEPQSAVISGRANEVESKWFSALRGWADRNRSLFGNAVFQLLWFMGFGFYFLRQLPSLFANPLSKELLTYIRLPDYAKHLGDIPVMRDNIKVMCNIRLGRLCGKPKRMLFVVDDLDRCSPAAIVKVLEALRLVLDLDDVIVLIAIDQHIALAALSNHFKEFSPHHKLKNSHAIAREYLSKVINLPIVLTAPSDADVKEFMTDLWKDMPKVLPVGAGDPGQKVPVDNSPAPSSSEMNLPVVDSTLELDSVLVTDISPDSDHTERVKSKATEDDKQVTAKVNPINALSPEQQASFIYWANYFELTNPRQLKRLNNSYDLMRSYLPQWDKEVVEFVLTEVDVLKVYPMLLTLILMEYLNSLHSLTERSQLWEKLFSEPVIAGFESAKVGIPRVKVTEINNKRVTSDFVKAYRSLLAAEGNKSLVSNVEAFVLPAMN